MRICVFGAGAVGSLIGARLELWATGTTGRGVEVSLVGRGPHLDAMRERGLILVDGEGRTAVRPRVTADAAELGPQDHVVVTVKAHALADAVAQMAPLLGPHTTVVGAQNGIPWWYFHALPGEWEGRRLESVDPGGRIWSSLRPERAVGCVVYPSCEIVEPGVVRHLGGTRVMLGEPDGTVTARVTELATALRAAGFRSPVRRRIRDDLWLKLWGNVAFNPVSALTLATLTEIGRHPPALAVVRALMVEASAVATRLGVRFPVDVETRIGWTLQAGEHRTSMLQDLERGRRIEIEALVGAVTELGRLTGIATPALDLVLGLLELRAAAAHPLPV